MPRWPRHSCVATGTRAPGGRGAWGGGRPRTQAPADRARRTHRDDRASDGRCQGTRDNRSTMLLVAVPRQVSSFRLLTLSCRYGMLFGSDCNNNTLRDVIGVKRGDTVSVETYRRKGAECPGEVRAVLRPEHLHGLHILARTRRPTFRWHPEGLKFLLQPADPHPE